MRFPDRGIYILSNDAVADWTKSLVQSIRRVEPTMPIVLVPFDENCKKMDRYATRRGLFVWRDEDILCRLDNVGYAFWPNNRIGAHLFRKLAIFAGPLDGFLYFDADCIVNQRLGDIVEASVRCPSRFLYSDAELSSAILATDSSLDSVDAGEWFNAGIFAYRSGVVSIQAIETLATGLLHHRTELISGEQSFLNLLLRQLEVPMSKFDNVVPNFPAHTFAKDIATLPRSDAAVWPIIHWAGESLHPAMSLRSIYRRHRVQARSPIDALSFLLWTSRLRPVARTIWRSRSLRRLRRRDA